MAKFHAQDNREFKLNGLDFYPIMFYFINCV